jgi:hypothetical protein
MMEPIINLNMEPTEFVVTVQLNGFGQIVIAGPHDSTEHQEFDRITSEFYRRYRRRPEVGPPQLIIAQIFIEKFGGKITQIEKGGGSGIVY